jgi:hypothetical protein
MQNDQRSPAGIFLPIPFQAIKHLLGVAEGPGDLSTNPDYMKGFGQNSLQ